MKKLENGYFIENISKYGLENGYCDYGSLAARLDAVILNNDIFKGEDFENWNPINDDLIYSIGIEFNDGEDEEVDFFDTYLDVLENTYQWYMVTHKDASLLNDFNEVVIYNDNLNVYLWCIGHYGTSWDYVLTDIKIKAV